MKAKLIKEILSEFLENSDFYSINENINIEKIWKKVVGDLIAKNTKFSSFTNGKIIITTKNPVWRNELSLQKASFIKKLNQELPDKQIKQIIFR